MDKMMKRPKVSVIVPVYNVERYLEECLESILDQTLEEIEIVCVDDGSTDRSAEMLDEYAAKDARIKVFHKANGGYGHAMNYGIVRSSGEYIGIVEPDDYIEPNMFEKLYTVAKKKDLDVVKSNMKRFYGDKDNRTFEYAPLSHDDKTVYYRVIIPAEEPSILNLTMNIVTGIYRNQFIKENHIVLNETPGASFQDNGFWIQTMMLAKNIYFVDEYFYAARRDNPNSSVKNTEKALCVIEEFRYIDQFLENHPQEREKFIYRYVFVKLIGYLSTYNRSSTQQKIVFLFEASKDLKKHVEAGEIERSLYNNAQWKKLNQIIADPVKFFIDDVQGTGRAAQTRLEETCERITETQNKLSRLTSVYGRLFSDSLDRIFENGQSSSNVKISVIVPAFNVEPYVRQCLDSILDQSIKEIEVICVDDGSSDNTFSILLEYVEKDSRVKAMTQINSGSGVARNKALDIATGEFVVFMDADDWYPDNFILEKMYNTALEKQVKVCGGSVAQYMEDGKTVIPPFDYHMFKEEGYIDYSDYQMQYGYTRYIYDLKLLKENSIRFPDYLRFQDPVFFVKVMSVAKEFYAIPDVTYCYRKGHKRVKWTTKQCTDLLHALRDVAVVAQTNDYSELYEDVVNRVLNEFFDKYIGYVVHNEPTVVQAFCEFIDALSEDKRAEIMSKLFYYVSVAYVIPLRKAGENRGGVVKQVIQTEDMMKLKQQLEEISSQAKQARFEVDSIRASWTFKIGRFITYIPRKIRCLSKGEK